MATLAIPIVRQYLFHTFLKHFCSKLPSLLITFLTALPSGFDNLASSLRYVGSLNNWQEDGLHLYFSEYFGGGEEIVLGNTQQLDHDNAAVSLIVTGCQPWTIFQDKTYEVKGFYFSPTDSHSAGLCHLCVPQLRGVLHSGLLSLRSVHQYPR